MKALSIKEVKQLKYGDWVWIKTNNSQYLRVNFSSENLCGETLCGIKTYYYADYGTKWLAYKNKEQAECKGELVELPRIIHPNELEWFVQYQYKSGVINYEIFYSLEKAEQKLKELRGRE